MRRTRGAAPARRGSLGAWHPGDVAYLDLSVPGRHDMHVRAQWTPAAGESPSIGWAWLQHGFARHGRHLDGVAAVLSGAGIAVLRPDLRSCAPHRSLHDREFIAGVVSAVVRALEYDVPGGHAARWIGVGHSAGAAVVATAAARMVERGQPPAGLVLLDPVDTVGHLLAGSLPGISEVDVTVLACPPSRCNRHGATVDALESRHRTSIERLPGLSHADPERIPATLRTGDVKPSARGVTWACGRGGTPAAVIDLGERARAAATAYLSAA